MNSFTPFRMSTVACTEPVAGFTPMTASPLPKERPSRTAASTPSTESRGWFGCRRLEMRPASPSVLLQRTTTRIFLPAMTRSMLLMSLATALAISPVRPCEIAAISSPEVSASRIHSRSWATLQFFTFW